jgi:hypothetical protein
MIRPKNIQKFVVRHLRWIELYLHDLCVPGFVGANIFICWILLCTTCVPDRCGQNALQFSKSFFHSPETAGTECSLLRLHMDTMTRLGALRNRGRCSLMVGFRPPEEQENAQRRKGNGAGCPMSNAERSII